MKMVAKGGCGIMESTGSGSNRDIKFEKRPVGCDFHWYLCDVVRTAQQFKMTGIPAYEDLRGQYPTQTRQQYAEYLDERYLNIPLMEKDWGQCLRGEKTLGEVTDPQHCLEKLLLDCPGILTVTRINAESLAQAIEKVLLEERCRNEYEGQQRDVIWRIHRKLREEDWISQQEAMKVFKLGDRRIRQLAECGKLIRATDNTGRIKSDSVRAEMNRRGIPLLK
jgi:hypothetical protein